MATGRNSCLRLSGSFCRPPYLRGQKTQSIAWYPPLARGIHGDEDASIGVDVHHPVHQLGRRLAGPNSGLDDLDLGELDAMTCRV